MIGDRRLVRVPERGTATVGALPVNYRIRILLVEDDRDSGEALKNLLEKSGVAVTLVATAEDVADNLDLAKFDVLVADIRLAGMSGIDLLEHVRKEYPDFPAILITGYDSLESAIQAVRLGAQDYILKPLDSIADLLIPVRKAVESHRLLLRNRELEVDLKRRCRQLRELGIRLGESQESERRRICRELHDRVGATLTSLGINLNMAREHLLEGRSDGSLAHLERAQVETEDIAGCLRRVMSELYPAVLDEYGLAAALRWYAEEFEKTTGIPVRASVNDLSGRLPRTVETTLFRIAQEGLTNVLKHAEARNVAVLLEETASAVKLAVDDDGKGFDTSADLSENGGLGMLFMRERAEAIGGDFRVTSLTGKGTTVVVTIGRDENGD